MWIDLGVHGRKLRLKKDQLWLFLVLVMLDLGYVCILLLFMIMLCKTKSRIRYRFCIRYGLCFDLVLVGIEFVEIEILTKKNMCPNPNNRGVKSVTISGYWQKPLTVTALAVIKFY
jgi:hypothetical protein